MFKLKPKEHDENLRHVTRFKSGKWITIKARDTLHKKVYVRLDFNEALKLAGLLLAMLFGTLVQWERVDEDTEMEEHEGD